MGRKQRFSDEQKEFIRNNYSSKSNKEIAEILECETKYIEYFGSREKLKKGNFRRVYLTDEEKEYIQKWYNIKPTGDIAKDLGYTTKKINDYAYNSGLRRDIKKKSVDIDYFKIINTPNKAYWLGFLYADGCILESKRNDKIKALVLELSLSTVDELHLERFKMSLKSNVDIKRRIISDKYEASRISICNTALCRDLIELGCYPRKSLTLEFPKEDQVPKEFIHHFIRGYFDGDGCIYVNDNTHKDGRVICGSARCSVSFVGTVSFLTELKSILIKTLGISDVVINTKKDTNTHSVMWGGESNLKTLYDYMYMGEDIIYLPRKMEKFLL